MGIIKVAQTLMIVPLVMTNFPVEMKGFKIYTVIIQIVDSRSSLSEYR